MRTTQLRRDLQREADKMGRKTLKGLRWLLIKHQEDLGQIWGQPNKTIAGRFLKNWCARARASGIKVLQTMANTLEGHRTGILNWYDFPISTGRLQGINNKIGALQRTAYGYRNRDYFIAKLYALHLAKFQLIG